MGATGANSDVPTGAACVGNGDLRRSTSRLLSQQWHTFLIRPHFPPLKIGKLLVPNVQLDFELHLNPNTVYLMGTPNKGTLTTKKFPAIHNEDIKVTLLMRKVTLNAAVYVRLQKERQLGKQIARYPVVRSEIRTFSFDGRTTQWEHDNVFVGRFPDRVMVGLLHSNAFNGDLGRYPFAFEKFGVTQVRQSLNGDYPYTTLQLTGDQAYEDLLGYDQFLQAMGVYDEHKIPMLLPSDWRQGKNCTLFMFNNVPSGKADDPQYRNPRQSGNVRLVIDFAAAVNHNVTMLVWCEYENTYEINHLGSSRSPPTSVRTAYIVNANPEGELGQHWLGLWTEQNNCKIFDSYGLPLHVYTNPDLHRWWTQWKYLIRSDITLQAMDSQTCGHYALFFLKARAQGQSYQDFLGQWRCNNLVLNDHKVAERLTRRTRVLDRMPHRRR